MANENNVIAVQVLGLGVGIKFTGFGSTFGRMWRGSKKAVNKAATKVAARTKV